jgi:hypothetical protein
VSLTKALKCAICASLRCAMNSAAPSRRRGVAPVAIYCMPRRRARRPACTRRDAQTLRLRPSDTDVMKRRQSEDPMCKPRLESSAQVEMAEN